MFVYQLKYVYSRLETSLFKGEDKRKNNLTT